MNISSIMSQITIAIGILVALTNIITEVAKLNIPALKSSENINRFATVFGVILTVIAGIAYSQIQGIALLWYHYIALVIVGLMVAFASMVGFDKLLSYFEKVGE